MNSFLRQSTASQVRTVGPFADDTDFKTLENALSIANTDIKIKKNGAASASKNSGGATADGSAGLYHLTWDATDSDTVGELTFSIKVAGALVVFGSYVVLEEAVYDALFAASAPGYGTAQTGDSFARLGAPAGASVSADIAAIEAQTDDIGAAGAGLTALGDARIANLDATVSSRATQASVDIIDDFLDTEVAAIKAKTDQLTFTFANQVDANTLSVGAAAINNAAFAANAISAGVIAPDAIGSSELATSAVTEIQTGLATQASLDLVKAKTDQLAFTIANQVDANTQSINDVTIIGNGQVGTEFGV